MIDKAISIVLNIDIVLVGVSIFFCLFIALYVIVKGYLENRRKRFLLAIKTNVHSLAISGQKPSGETCPTVSAKTPEQFLDVEMDREELLFDEPEKQFIKECFVTSDKILAIQTIAKNSKNKWRRIEAVLSLGYAEDLSSLDIIKEALYDRDDDVAYFSMLALGLIKNVKSAKILLDYLKKNIFRASKIASILEAFPVSITDEVIKLTDDPDASVRFWAIKLISKLNPKAYTGKVEELTRDPSADVRSAACECLGKIGHKEAKASLLKCLKDSAWYVRMQAVRALSTILGEEAIPDIAGLMKDDSVLVKDSVKTAMSGHIETSRPFIEKILSGQGELIKKEAIEALEISGYMTKVLHDLISEDNKRREASTSLLRAVIKASAHSGVESALDDFTGNMQDRILTAIKDIDKPFAEHMEKKLKHQIEEI